MGYLCDDPGGGVDLGFPADALRRRFWEDVGVADGLGDAEKGDAALQALPFCLGGL